MMAQGSYQEARMIFEELANGAAQRGIPRAPQLFLRAGESALKAGEQGPAVELFTRGLRLMAELGQTHRLPAVSRRVLDELQSAGLKEECEALEKEISQLLASVDMEIATSSPQRKRRLPGKCPQCGGIVHPQEVEWIDESTASCDYCGSILELAL
jgi:hypothetical protein